MVGRHAPRSGRTLGVIVCLAGAALGGVSQTPPPAKNIIVRVVDVKTGRQIETPDFLVLINHQTTAHADWITENHDGAGQVALPPEATEVAIRVKYDRAMEFYINCDTEKERKAVHYADVPDHWYPVGEILARGILAADECKSKETGKHDYFAKPGEIVLFVRQHNLRESAND